MAFRSWVFILLLIFFQSGLSAAEKTQPFILKDMQGVKHSLSQYRGQWVLVNYWATWCPPCLEEVPDLIGLYDKYKTKKLMVLGVVFDYKDTLEVESYIDDMLMPYPIVLGDDAVVAQIGAADVMPTTFIYNPQGKLVKIKRGLITRHYVEQMMGVK